MLMWCYLRLRRWGGVVWGGVVWGGVGFGLGWGGQGCNITFMYVADLWCDVDADRFFKGDWRRKQQVQGLHRVNIQSLLIRFITFLIFLDFSKAVFGGIFQRQPDYFYWGLSREQPFAGDEALVLTWVWASCLLGTLIHLQPCWGPLALEWIIY